jgi:hypothetical protein
MTICYFVVWFGGLVTWWPGGGWLGGLVAKWFCSFVLVWWPGGTWQADHQATKPTNKTTKP